MQSYWPGPVPSLNRPWRVSSPRIPRSSRTRRVPAERAGCPLTRHARTARRGPAARGPPATRLGHRRARDRWRASRGLRRVPGGRPGRGKFRPLGHRPRARRHPQRQPAQRGEASIAGRGAGNRRYRRGIWRPGRESRIGRRHPARPGTGRAVRRGPRVRGGPATSPLRRFRGRAGRCRAAADAAVGRGADGCQPRGPGLCAGTASQVARAVHEVVAAMRTVDQAGSNDRALRVLSVTTEQRRKP